MITELTWPIKESLLGYLEMMEARIETRGADRTPEGFCFPVDPDAAGVEWLVFVGEVHITAHGGLLDVTIARPRIGRDGDHAVLRSTSARGEIGLARLLDYPQDDAGLRQDGGVLTDVALTMDGAALLGGVYAPWTRLAPIVLRAGGPSPR